MSKAKVAYLSFDDYTVPVKMYREWRNNVRYSIGRKYASIRVPLLFSKKKLQQELYKFEDWAIHHFHSDKKIAQRFLNKSYWTGQILSVRDRSFTLQIQPEQRKTNTAKMVGNRILIKINKDLNTFEKSKTIPKLLSGVLSKVFKKDLEYRVRELNELHFNKEINEVRMKYNQSNWGSCSSKKNINLSTRLLLAPSEIVDYVIIHELAHLEELNHSQKFWRLVGKAMPDYKKKESWLKLNGHSLNF